MGLVDIALAQLRSVWNNPEENLERVDLAASAAADGGASLIVFPERFATGGIRYRHLLRRISTILWSAVSRILPGAMRSPSLDRLCGGEVVIFACLDPGRVEEERAQIPVSRER